MIKYKSGFKYQLVEDYEYQTPFRPKETLAIEYVSLNVDGMLKIRAGYAWDGPSGPTIDTRNFMRGSLVHDVLYELIYYELLDYRSKSEADRILINILEEDRMSKCRRWWVLQGVKFGGDPKPSRIKQIYTAP